MSDESSVQCKHLYQDTLMAVISYPRKLDQTSILIIPRTLLAREFHLLNLTGIILRAPVPTASKPSERPMAAIPIDRNNHV